MSSPPPHPPPPSTFSLINQGLGNELDHRLPVRVEVPGAPTITTACCGWRHTAAVDAEGRLYTWGWNKYGQLGLGNHE